MVVKRSALMIVHVPLQREIQQGLNEDGGAFPPMYHV